MKWIGSMLVRLCFAETDVFFDNLSVQHRTGPVTEETHYYPFGLTMAGISSKAVGKLENKYKFNDGTELNSSFDIFLYETDFRLYDPQIGRFLQIDLLADVVNDYSPFIYANNNPFLLNDPLGLLSDSLNPQVLPEVVVVANKNSAAFKKLQPYIKDYLPNAEDLIRSIVNYENSIIPKLGPVGSSYVPQYRTPAELEAAEKFEGVAIEAVTWFIPLGKLVKLPKAFKVLRSLLRLKKAKTLTSLTFKELQALVREYSGPMNAFFKSGGKKVPEKHILEAYKELTVRILNGTGGAPASKATETAIKVQTERLELINKVLETLK